MCVCVCARVRVCDAEREIYRITCAPTNFDLVVFSGDMGDKGQKGSVGRHGKIGPIGSKGICDALLAPFPPRLVARVL